MVVIINDDKKKMNKVKKKNKDLYNVVNLYNF